MSEDNVNLYADTAQPEIAAAEPAPAPAPAPEAAAPADHQQAAAPAEHGQPRGDDGGIARAEQPPADLSRYGGTSTYGGASAYGAGGYGGASSYGVGGAGGYGGGAGGGARERRDNDWVSTQVAARRAHTRFHADGQCGRVAAGGPL
jgi:hypothetical protein